MKLPDELRSPKKELINIKNNDQKCFLWCHIRHINPVKVHPEQITKEDKKLVKELDYGDVNFPVQEKDFRETETRNKFVLTYFVTKIGSLFQFMFQIKNLKTQWICCL